MQVLPNSAGQGEEFEPDGGLRDSDIIRNGICCTAGAF